VPDWQARSCALTVKGEISGCQLGGGREIAELEAPSWGGKVGVGIIWVAQETFNDDL
jgi:hypothetical protein